MNINQSLNHINSAEIIKYLKGLDFPVNKSEIIIHCEENDAPKEVMDMVHELDNKKYNSVIDISKKLSELGKN